jgi:hypothetical protein
MRLAKTLEVLLLAIFAISATTAPGASAHEFEYSVIPTLLLAKADGTQVFKTLAGTLTCNTLMGHGIQESLAFKSVKLVTSYTGCVIENRLKITAKPDEPIGVEYEFGAEGIVTILKPIAILATLAGTKCTISVKAQGPLTSITYTSKGTKEVLFGANTSGLETSAVGAGCSETYTSSKTGTYVGNSIVAATGTGEFAWK